MEGSVATEGKRLAPWFVFGCAGAVSTASGFDTACPALHGSAGTRTGRTPPFRAGPPRRTGRAQLRHPAPRLSVVEISASWAQVDSQTIGYSSRATNKGDAGRYGGAGR